MPRALTDEELRDKLLDHFRSIARHWSTVKIEDEQQGSLQSRIDGAIFSVLSTLDGCTLGIPPFDLVAQPSVDDKQYCVDNDEDWIEPGTKISTMLHEFWHLPDDCGERYSNC